MRKIPASIARTLGALLVLGALAAGTAQAAWPDRTITIIVIFAPGGSNDLLGRLIAAELAPALGQNVIVENRAGANGNIGLAAGARAALASEASGQRGDSIVRAPGTRPEPGSSARAAPDGYTLVVASGVVVINPSVAKVTYDPLKDFAPIAYLGDSPNVILTRPATGIVDVAELIKKAKADPGKLTFATPGTGSVSQLAVELLKLRTNIDLTHVPFSGAGPAAQAAIAGTTDLASVNVAGLIGHIQSGTLKALVQTGKERWPDLSDVPTLEQAGIPNAVVDTSQMFLAPAGTPAPIVERLAKETLAILQKPDVREKMLKASFAVKYEGPEELRGRMAREVPMWKDLVERAGIREK